MNTWRTAVATTRKYARRRLFAFFVRQRANAVSCALAKRFRLRKSFWPGGLCFLFPMSAMSGRTDRVRAEESNSRQRKRRASCPPRVKCRNQAILPNNTLLAGRLFQYCAAQTSTALRSRSSLIILSAQICHSGLAPTGLSELRRSLYDSRRASDVMSRKPDFVLSNKEQRDDLDHTCDYRAALRNGSHKLSFCGDRHLV